MNMENENLLEKVKDEELKNVVLRYIQSTNVTLLKDFESIINFINNKKSVIDKTDFLLSMTIVMNNYIEKLTKKQLPFKDYIPSNYKFIKPFKEELINLEKNNEPHNFNIEEALEKYDIYTVTSMLYLVKLHNYRFNKKNGIKDKYFGNTNTNDQFSISDNNFSPYQEKLYQCSTVEELVKVYDEDRPTICKMVTDMVEEANIKDPTKAKNYSSQLMAKYVNVFFNVRNKLEENLNINENYKSAMPTRDIVYAMLTPIRLKDMTMEESYPIIEEITNVLNYRRFAHHVDGEECCKLLEELTEIARLVNGQIMSLPMAIDYMFIPKRRIEISKTLGL